MTTARIVEHRITQNLLQRHNRGVHSGNSRWVERVINVVAVCVGMLLLGSYAPELLAALMAAAAVLTLGTRLSH
ncbi:MAG: hypothetical protein AAGI44_11995 [Pseudomonadota bacterium]